MADEVKPWSFTDICRGLGILIVSFGAAGGGLGALWVSIQTHEKVSNVQSVQAENRESILKGVQAAEGAEKKAGGAEVAAKKTDSAVESIFMK